LTSSKNILLQGVGELHVVFSVLPCLCGNKNSPTDQLFNFKVGVPYGSPGFFIETEKLY
jgi:hypothetical protein